MKRLLSFLILFAFTLNILGCGFEHVLNAKGDHSVQSATTDGALVVTINRDCPSQDSSHHDSDQPCDGDCHHHGHCHCGFLVSSTNLSCPTLDSSNGMRVINFNPGPHLGNLFRPPIS